MSDLLSLRNDRGGIDTLVGVDAREDDIDEEQNAPNITTHGAALASDE